MTQAKERSHSTPPREQLLSATDYLYDPHKIAALRELIGERPVVVFNGMDTIYAPDPSNPDGERKPFPGAQLTINDIRKQLPDVFIIGWTGKGPRSNVEKVGDIFDLVIGEENLVIPQGTSEDDVKRDYLDLVNSADWLSRIPNQQQELKDLWKPGSSLSVKIPQLFARGPIVIVDNDKNKENNIPGKNNPLVKFIDSDHWAKRRIVPRQLATTVVMSRPSLSH